MSTVISNLIATSQVLYSDSFAYHLTKKEYMKEITIQGLKPLCGENSKSIGDTRKAIYFFTNLQYLYAWVEALYSLDDASQLELLRFNLKRRKWYPVCPSFGEGYLERNIVPEKLEYAVISKSTPKELKIKWKKLEAYPLVQDCN